ARREDRWVHDEPGGHAGAARDRRLSPAAADLGPSRRGARATGGPPTGAIAMAPKDRRDAAEARLGHSGTGGPGAIAVRAATGRRSDRERLRSAPRFLGRDMGISIYDPEMGRARAALWHTMLVPECRRRSPAAAAQQTVHPVCPTPGALCCVPG